MFLGIKKPPGFGGPKQGGIWRLIGRGSKWSYYYLPYRGGYNPEGIDGTISDPMTRYVIYSNWGCMFLPYRGGYNDETSADTIAEVFANIYRHKSLLFK